VIIDSLVYLGTSHFGYSLDPPTAMARLDAAGTDAAIAVPVHPRGHDFAEANDLVLKAADSSGGRLTALARVDPWEGPAALAEITRAAAAGARGLFLHPSEEHFPITDAERARPLIECAASLGLPVMIAAGYHLFAEPLQLGHVSRWAPEISFVLTNGGQLNISGGSQFDALLALRNPNVHVQTSAMYREDYLEKVVADYGPERLLYASAVPAFSMAYERERVSLAHFSDTERELILGGNAARIFGLEDHRGR
jgi:predicted TIM-barrel fold metal-dependent hydrolase